VGFISWWRGGIADVGFGYAVEVVWLFEWRLLPLFLLAKDLDGVLELCEPCSLSIYMLPSIFSTLSCGLPASDGFLFLTRHSISC
jgi:hypothetical protein